MKNKEKINDKKYYTCGRCKHKYGPENERPCISCIYDTDEADLWEYKKEKEN